MTWNGRQIAAYSACADCSVWQMGIISVTRYAQVSAQPGAYVATFGIYDDVPQQCNEDPTTHEPGAATMEAAGAAGARAIRTAPARCRRVW